VTVHASLAVARRLLDGPPVVPGHRTPSQLMGDDFIETLPGSGRIELHRDRAWDPRFPA
jgi:short subunit dehydrogenase-like uncharacterized protein